MSDELYGLDPAVRLVREFVDRPGDGRILQSRRLPALIFSGPHGTGKTALLAALESKLRGNIPHASLDFAEAPERTTTDVLTRLAFGLNRKSGMYGRLAFPRLTVGLITMKTVLDIPGPDAARRQLTNELARARRIPRIRQILSDAAADLWFGSTIPGLKTLVRLLPGLVIDFLMLFLFGRKMMLGRGFAWYGVDGIDPIDALMELNEWAQHPGVGGNQTLIDRLLMDAFLTDLRYAFGRSRRAARRPLNCMILLDNADTDTGEEFLRQLYSTREHGVDPDPVTVVATARPRDDDPALSIETIDPSHLPFDDWQDRKRLPVRLDDLEESEVTRMIGSGRPRRGVQLSPYVAEVVYRFTRGHPGSTALLVNEFRGREDRPLSEILDGAVTERLRGGLLEGFPRASIDALTTCAAARDLREMSRLGGLVDEADIDLIYDRWSLLHASGDASVMQPVLRRLLLRDLAKRDDDAENGWPQVFARLRERAGDDEQAQLYHTLALGEVEPVARWFDRRLGDPDGRPELMDADRWLPMLEAVTAAPVRNPPAQEPHEVEISWAGRRDSRPGRVAYLVAGLRLADEPLTGLDRRTLHDRIAGAYLGLRTVAPAGRRVFGREATRHEELARIWPNADRER